MKHVLPKSRLRRRDSLSRERFGSRRRASGIYCVRCSREIGYWEPMHWVAGWSCEGCMTAAELADMDREHHNLVGVDS